MKSWFSRFASDYGMLFVLLGLCVFFSIMTVSDQSPSGESGAVQLTGLIQSGGEPAPTVLIVTGTLPDDQAFATRLEADLNAAGIRVIGVVRGDARDARQALVRAVEEKVGISVIACTQTSGNWLVFSDLATDFPALSTTRVLVPRGYRWPNFLKSDNLLNVANQIVIIAVVAIGMTMVIITGGIDLSVGSLIALSAVLATRLIRDYCGGVTAGSVGMILSSVAAIVVCGLVGGLSGLMVTQFGIPPFIVTLAMMLMGSGLAFMIAEGQSIYQLPDSFTALGRGTSLFGLPNAVILMFVLYVLAHVVMSRMKIGRYLYAAGGNREAARLSGVNVTRVVQGAYLVSGVLAGLGGVLMASQLKSGSANYGGMYELFVIAAVVVGGTSLSGGEGKMPGTLIGALTIGVIQNGMNLMNIGTYPQKVVLGFVILTAVLLDSLRHRKQAG